MISCFLFFGVHFQFLFLYMVRSKLLFLAAGSSHCCTALWGCLGVELRFTSEIFYYYYYWGLSVCRYRHGDERVGGGGGHSVRQSLREGGEERRGRGDGGGWRWQLAGEDPRVFFLPCSLITTGTSTQFSEFRADRISPVLSSMKTFSNTFVLYSSFFFFFSQCCFYSKE